jgi:hypothetical protein
MDHHALTNGALDRHMSQTSTPTAKPIELDRRATQCARLDRAALAGYRRTAQGAEATAGLA